MIVPVLSASIGWAGPAGEVSQSDAEEVYELRLERLLKAGGGRAVVALLARDLEERPRPYVKAWYAIYLLYGAEFGLDDIADPARGFALAQEAATEGSPFGIEVVGRAWGDGRGTERRPDLAIKFLSSAGEKGRYTAWGELGKYYFFGAGVEKNLATAEQLIRKSAWMGAASPMFTLAQWHENPAYVPTPDRSKANALYYEVGELASADARKLLRTRAKAGDIDAQKYVHLDLVVIAMRGYDALPSHLRAAVKWLEENSAAGDVQVQLALADAMKERSLVIYDPAKSRAKAEQAARAGNLDGRALLAEMAWRGIDQKTDKAAAVASWRELAEQGNARALNFIGWLHWWGNGEQYGVPKDAGKAYDYCRRSAELGYSIGQLNLAECYAHGIGVPKNYYRAAKYYGILEDRRYKDAKRMKERILAYIAD